MKYWSIFSVCFILFSCQKKMASFMPSSYEKYNKSTERGIIKAEKIKSESFKATNPVIVLPKIVSDAKPLKKETRQSNISIYNKDDQKITLNNTTENTTNFDPNKKPRKRVIKRLSPFNDSVKIGTVLLAIAIILAFIPVSQLSLLFGVASLIFFILGLKTYLRKKRRRDFFKRITKN